MVFIYDLTKHIICCMCTSFFNAFYEEKKFFLYLLFRTCQAAPYVWTLFYCPSHFLTHELLLFATGVWTTNIHDCLHGK